MQDITFFSDDSLYVLKKRNNISYYIKNARTNNEYDADASSGDYGLNLSSQNICRFKFYSVGYNSITNPNTISYEAPWRIGYSGNDNSGYFSNDFFSIYQSESKDAIINETNLSQEFKYRRRGWYLGVDISDIEIKNVNLTSYPDIFYNTYKPWTIKLEQEFAPKGSTQMQSISSEYNFIIAKKQNNDISINTVTTLDYNLNSYFFGLKRYSDLRFFINGDLTNIDPNWRLYNNNILETKFKYSTNEIDHFNINWNEVTLHATTKIITTDVSVNFNTLFDSHKYSRNLSNSIQFYIDGSYESNPIGNNIPQMAQTMPIINLTEANLNNKELWWDYTWENTSNAPNPNWVFDNVEVNFLTRFMNVGTVLYPPLNEVSIAYNHSIEPVNNMMIWANETFWASNNTDNDNNDPFIDYRIYFEQIQDYSNKSTTGIDLSINYYSGLMINNNSIGYGFITNIYDDTPNNMYIPSWYSGDKLKFIVLKYNPPLNTSICKFIATSKNNTILTLGQDYYLQLMECDSTGNQLTEWRDCQIYSRSSTKEERDASGGPAFWKRLNYYDNSFSQYDTNGYNILISNSNQRVILYFRIGISVSISDSNINNIKYIKIDGLSYPGVDSYFCRPKAPTDIIFIILNMMK